MVRTCPNHGTSSAARSLAVTAHELAYVTVVASVELPSGFNTPGSEYPVALSAVTSTRRPLPSSVPVTTPVVSYPVHRAPLVELEYVTFPRYVNPVP